MRTVHFVLRCILYLIGIILVSAIAIVTRIGLHRILGGDAGDSGLIRFVLTLTSVIVGAFIAALGCIVLYVGASLFLAAARRIASSLTGWSSASISPNSHGHERLRK